MSRAKGIFKKLRSQGLAALDDLMPESLFLDSKRSPDCGSSRVAERTKVSYAITTALRCCRSTSYPFMRARKPVIRQGPQLAADLTLTAFGGFRLVAAGQLWQASGR